MLTFNTITICGHVGNRRIFERDGAITMVKLSVATNRKREGEDETTWFDVLLWGKTAEYAAGNVEKGDAVIVEGSVNDRKDEQGRTWKDVHCRQLVKTATGGGRVS